MKNSRSLRFQLVKKTIQLLSLFLVCVLLKIQNIPPANGTNSRNYGAKVVSTLAFNLIMPNNHPERHKIKQADLPSIFAYRESQTIITSDFIQQKK